MKDYSLTFKKGNILTENTLSLLHYLPKNTLKVLFNDNSEGIICGMNFDVKENMIIISPGIFKKNGRLFVLDSEKQIYFKSDGVERDYHVYMTGITETVTEDRSITVSMIEFGIKSGEFAEGETRVFSFRTTPKLPESITDLTSAAYCDFSACIYSAYDEATYVPNVFKIIYKLLLQKKNKKAIDYMIMSVISTEKVVPKSIIRMYVAEILGFSHDQVTTFNDKELLKKFCTAVRYEESSMPNKTEVKKEQKQSGPKWID